MTLTHKKSDCQNVEQFKGDICQILIIILLNMSIVELKQAKKSF